MIMEIKKRMFVNFYNYSLSLNEEEKANGFNAFDMTYALSILLDEDKEDLMKEYIKFINSIVSKGKH